MSYFLSVIISSLMKLFFFPLFRIQKLKKKKQKLKITKCLYFEVCQCYLLNKLVLSVYDRNCHLKKQHKSYVRYLHEIIYKTGKLNISYNQNRYEK